MSEDIVKEGLKKYDDWRKRGRPKDETDPVNVARFAKLVFGAPEAEADEKK